MFSHKNAIENMRRERAAQEQACKQNLQGIYEPPETLVSIMRSKLITDPNLVPEYAGLRAKGLIADRRSNQELYQMSMSMMLPHHELSQCLDSISRSPHTMLGLIDDSYCLSMCKRFFDHSHYIRDMNKTWYRAKSTGVVYHEDDIRKVASWWLAWCGHLYRTGQINEHALVPQTPPPWEFVNNEAAVKDCLKIAISDDDRYLITTIYDASKSGKTAAQVKGNIMQVVYQNQMQPNQMQPMMQQFSQQQMQQPMMQPNQPMQPMMQQQMQPMQPMMHPNQMQQQGVHIGNDNYGNPIIVSREQYQYMLMQQQQQPPMQQNNLSAAICAPTMSNQSNMFGNFKPEEPYVSEYAKSGFAKRAPIEPKQTQQQFAQPQAQAKAEEDLPPPNFGGAFGRKQQVVAQAQPQVQPQQQPAQPQSYQEAARAHAQQNIMQLKPTVVPQESNKDKAAQLNDAILKGTVARFPDMYQCCKETLAYTPKIQSISMLNLSEEHFKAVWVQYILGALKFPEYNNHEFLSFMRSKFFISRGEKNTSEEEVAFTMSCCGIIRYYEDNIVKGEVTINEHFGQDVARKLFCWYMIERLDSKKYISSHPLVREGEHLYAQFFNAHTEQERRDADKHPLIVYMRNQRTAIEDNFIPVLELTWPSQLTERRAYSQQQDTQLQMPVVTQQPQPVEQPIHNGAVPIGYRARGIPDPKDAPHLFVTYKSPEGFLLTRLKTDVEAERIRMETNGPTEGGFSFENMWKKAHVDALGAERAQEIETSKPKKRAIDIYNNVYSLYDCLQDMKQHAHEWEPIEYDEQAFEQAMRNADPVTMVCMSESRLKHLTERFWEANNSLEFDELQEVEAILEGPLLDKIRKAGPDGSWTSYPNKAVEVEEPKADKKFLESLTKPTKDYEVVSQSVWFAANEGSVVLPMVIESEQRIEFRQMDSGEVIYHVIQLTAKERQEKLGEMVMKARNRGQVITASELSDGPEINPEFTITNLQETHVYSDSDEADAYTQCVAITDTSSNYVMNTLRAELEGRAEDDDNENNVVYTRLGILKYDFMKTEDNTKPLHFMRTVLNCPSFNNVAVHLNTHMNNPTADIDCVRASNLVDDVATKAVNSFLANELGLDTRVKSMRKEGKELIATVRGLHGEHVATQLENAQKAIISNMYKIADEGDITEALESSSGKMITPSYIMGVLVPSTYVGVNKTEAQLQLMNVQGNSPVVVTDAYVNALIDSIFEHEDSIERQLGTVYMLTRDGQLFSIHRQGEIDNAGKRNTEDGSSVYVNLIRRIQD